MKIERTKNATRNVAFGIFLKLYQIVLPFAMRTVMVYALGIQYLGLNSLFVSVLQVLNLAELGVGTAMVFSMYKPIAEDDEVMICALMRLYKIYYRIIGLVILVLGLVLTPFIPHLISGEVPAELNVYILYLLNLGATVLTYWLFAYRNSILEAHQREDIISKVNICTDTVKYLLQIIALVVFHNYYLYVIVILFTQVLANISSAIVSHKMYPQYNPKGKLTKEETSAINHRIKDLFTARFGQVILTSADTIVISAFLGLKLLAQYQNYYYILNAVLSLIVVINTSVLAGFGNSMLTESLEENYKTFENFSFIEFWIMGFCVCCFSTLYQPFMTIWMGEELLFRYPMVILLCVYFMGYQFEKLLSVFKDAGGIWHEDRYRPLCYGLANLAINLILVQFLGIYGIVLSTILSVFLISIPWITRNVFTLIYKRSAVPYLKKLALYLAVILISALLVNGICALIPGGPWIQLVARLLVCLVVPNGFYALVYRKKPEFAKMTGVAKRFVKRG